MYKISADGTAVVMVMRPKGSWAPRVWQVSNKAWGCFSWIQRWCCRKSWFEWLQVIILNDRGSPATMFCFIYFFLSLLATMHPPEYSLGSSICLVRSIQHTSPVNGCSTTSPCWNDDNMTIWSQQCVGECSLSNDAARSGSVPTWSGQAWSCWVYYSSEWFWSWIKPGMERCTMVCTSSLWPRLYLV